MKLKWNSAEYKNYPIKLKPCILKVANPNTYIFGCWNDGWQINLYNNLPMQHDDSGGIYHTQVIAWAYVPRDLLNDLDFEHCSCYRKNYYNDKIDRCIGTKEIDPCDCKGNKLYCDFY